MIATRRDFLSRAGRGAFAVAFTPALVSLAACSQTNTPVKLGIAAGTQTLWRYAAAKKDELFKSTGYQPSFTVFESEAQGRQSFLDGKIDIYAALGSQLPILSTGSSSVQMFSPIAWVAESLPIIVPRELVASTLTDLSGKRLAIPGLEDPGFAFWRAMTLANYGFKIEEQMRLNDQTIDPAAALTAGQVDGAVVNSSIWSALKPTGAYRIVSDLSAEWKKLSGSARPLVYGGYIAKKSWIDSNQKFVDEFTKINAEALKQFQTSKDAFIKSAGEWVNPLSGALNATDTAAISGYLGMDSVAPDRSYVGDADVTDFVKVFDAMAKAGVYREPPKSSNEYFYLNGNRPKSS